MKNKSLIAILMVTAISPFFTQTVDAGSRYATPPPAVLSPNLTAPWVLQLNNRPVAEPVFGIKRTSSRRLRTPKYNVRLAPPAHPGLRTPGHKISFRTVTDKRYGHKKRTRASNPPIFGKKYQPVKKRRVQTVFAPKQNYVPAYSAPRPAHVAVKKSNPSRQMDPRFEPQIVSYSTAKKPGSIIIDTNDKFLYLVMRNGEARRYGVGVGKPGFEWAGTHKVTRKAEWPDWRPPAEMIAREKKKGRNLPSVMVGGPKNPLGARALYLGSTLYRIHGTNSPWTIGKAVSSGCIRMRNEDVMDLYERVGVGTSVTVS